MKTNWTWKDQIRIARTYLDSCEKTAYIELGHLGNPIQFMREQLDEIEKILKRRRTTVQQALGSEDK